MKLKAQAKPNPTWQNSSLEPPAKLVASSARNALAQSGERFTIGEVSGPVH
jgi:N12 class adenine-specific DNA methylase